MNHPRSFRRLLTHIAGMLAMALVTAIAVPHRHEGASPHPASTCRACKIQDGFSATPEGTARPVLAVASFTLALATLPDVCVLAPPASPLTSRAPPRSS